MMQIEVGHIRPDEWDQHFRIASEAFNGPRELPPERVLLAEENMLVARANGALVAVAGVADFGQTFDDVVLTMGGVTGVAVSAEATGRGLGRQLMTDLVRLMDERGTHVSLLSPSTSTLYRSVGYEQSSTFVRREITLQDLRPDIPDGITVERAGLEVFDDYRHLHEAHARRSHGWLTRDDWYWARRVQAVRTSATHVPIYVAKQNGAAVAVAAVKHRDGSDHPFAGHDLILLDIFGEPDGLTAIAATLRGTSTVAGYVHTTMSYADLPAITDRPELCIVKQEDPMMGRIISLTTAIAARGGGHFTDAIHLRTHDELLPANNGSFVVSWSGDTLGVEPGGSGDIELGIGDMASVFSGYVAPATLAARGRLGSAAQDNDIRRMTRWLACPTPTVVDGF